MTTAQENGASDNSKETSLPRTMAAAARKEGTECCAGGSGQILARGGRGRTLSNTTSPLA
eukprot:7286033-Pyramimonas_sp.AAC.1